MGKQKVFMIGNAHLDPAWVWSWQEGSSEAKATLFTEFKEQSKGEIQL